MLELAEMIWRKVHGAEQALPLRVATSRSPSTSNTARRRSRRRSGCLGFEADDILGRDSGRGHPVDRRADSAGDDLTPPVAGGGGRAERRRRSQALWLIVPVYNEAENFPALVAEVERHVPPPFEMLVVYDFEEDTTLPVARELARTRPWLRLVKNRAGPWGRQRDPRRLRRGRRAVRRW